MSTYRLENSSKKMATNPAQWPSFENWSVKYAEHARRRFHLLEAPVTLLQRWWRQRNVPRPRQRLYPIILGKRAHSVRYCCAELRKEEELLSKHVWCFEKLDGTNVGVRCDGALFGRRLQISGDSYQRVPLLGALPDTSIIVHVKERLLSATNAAVSDAVNLLVYGELMCNPGRYSYDRRDMGKRWYAFGAVIQTHKIEPAMAEQICTALVSDGFLSTMSPDASKITIRLNDKLSDLFVEHAVPCVPFLTSGSLKDVCTSLKERLLKTELQEGVVLTGDEFMAKWKTSLEDESKGNALLTSLLRDYSETAFELCGVDRAMMELLVDVSRRDNVKDTRQSSSSAKAVMKKTRKSVPAAFEDDILEAALHSAQTKFDSVESYFARDARNEIISLLLDEVVNDVVAKTPEEMACATTFVKKQVGVAFGKWLREQK